MGLYQTVMQVDYTVTFSEPVSGMGGSDVTVTGGTLVADLVWLHRMVCQLHSQ